MPYSWKLNAKSRVRFVGELNINFETMATFQFCHVCVSVWHPFTSYKITITVRGGIA
jgi:hypothetical protein